MRITIPLSITALAAALAAGTTAQTRSTPTEPQNQSIVTAEAPQQAAREAARNKSAAQIEFLMEALRTSLAEVRMGELARTRGDPGRFRSSDAVERGFCRDCGTPLFYRKLDRDRISVAIGSLDEPDRVAPAIQYGIENKSRHFDGLPALPAENTSEDYGTTSHQHPDHDSAIWPPP